MMSILDRILNKSVRKEDPSQLVLFTVAKKQEEIPEVEEWPMSQILSFEKSLLGMYVTSHPLHSYTNIVKHLSRRQIISLYEEERYGEVIICGVVEKARIITTRRNNERMAILRVEDESSSVEVFVFPRLFEEASQYIKERTIVLIKGKLESKEKMPKILAEKIIPIEQVWDNIKGVNISIEKDKFPLNELKTIFNTNRGKTPVVFAFKDSKMQGIKIKTANNFCLSLSPELLDKIGALIGDQNLSVSL
jgi:DNA polymerase-3 subunit alpha